MALNSRDKQPGLDSIESAIAMSAEAQMPDPDMYRYQVGVEKPSTDGLDLRPYRYRVNNVMNRGND